jgi:DNA-binding transcriptional ArsR family regulator
MSGNSEEMVHQPKAHNRQAKTGAPWAPLTWDIGTAYDLFVSLAVLHLPERFGLRPSWAAGVRSRLPAVERRLLEDLYPLLWVPLHWIHSLPAPKDAASALRSLGQLPPEERLPALVLGQNLPEGVPEILRRLAGAGLWQEADLEAVRAASRGREHPHSPQEVARFLDWWIRPAEAGDLLLAALASYQAVFFAEEEQRIAPALQNGLDFARDLSRALPLPELVEELSQGVHFDEADFRVSEVVLAPTFWSTPLVIYARAVDGPTVLLFGARPAAASLVPGEQVPDALLQALKALADPTRLRILRYLAGETLSPSELSRRLRLRAPTVTHHLSALRLAGLVRLTLQAGGEKCYTVRSEAALAAFEALQAFLEVKDS